MKVCARTRLWNVMESCRRMSNQGNEVVSHRLRRYVSVEYERRLANQGNSTWLLYCISINICEERNSECEGQRRISLKRGEVNNGKKKVPASYHNTWEPERNLGNAQPLITEYKIAQPSDFPEYNHHHKARKQKP